MAFQVGHGIPERRIVWLIFDEMDERLTFVDRDPGLRLPELDRFRAASFSADDARSGRVTLVSLPSLLAGKQVTSARALAPDDLLVTYSSGGTAHSENEPNLFSRAREAGFDSALAGSVHPYGRMFNVASASASGWNCRIPITALVMRCLKLPSARSAA